MPQSPIYPFRHQGDRDMVDRRAYVDLLEESFPGIKANIGHCEALGFPWESKQFLSEDENREVLSHVGCLEYPILIGGRTCRAGALHAVCTKITHRRQGLASELIKKVLESVKNRFEFVVLFTEMPNFYEKLSFQYIHEHRFRLACQRPKGSQSMRSLLAPSDNALFVHTFQGRAPLSSNVWVKDYGSIASFNTLFATYPAYWSLAYSATMKAIISYQVKDKALHLYDVIASKLPTIEQILDHLPSPIEEIYFYFSPELFTTEATSEHYVHDRGYLMVHGEWPESQPFMIPPLSRC